MTHYAEAADTTAVMLLGSGRMRRMVPGAADSKPAGAVYPRVLAGWHGVIGSLLLSKGRQEHDTQR